MNVIDAKTMSADPVAVVELPNRVPYGFHAFFVTEVRMAPLLTCICEMCCFSGVLSCKICL